MNNKQKTQQALQHAIDRIATGQVRKANSGDLQLVILQEISDKLDELIQLQQQSKEKQAEPGISASDEIPEPEPTKRKRKKLFAWRFRH